ncbi:MAG TPA: preprotein translocase subunit SecG, partial [Caulobacteraceae bacterium]|nr:preprotein translocase subunit SecG [Caulobacteraceae bacterium]
IALIAVVLLQRSEGGAFGIGGSPTGLVTARGAGDLLTRTTWVLFAAFMALSLGLTLLGQHDRSTSALIDKLKLQQVNPAAATQKPEPAPPAGQGGAPAPSAPFSPFGAAPAPQAAPSPFSAPLPVAPPAAEPTAKPAAAHAAKRAVRKPVAAASSAPSATPAQAVPTLEPPPPPAKSSAPAAGQP